MAEDFHREGFFVGKVLERAAAEHTNKIALIAREGEMSFATVNAKAACLAGHLQREGVSQGERVGVLLPNSIAFALSYYATQKMGAVTVVLDARLRGKELLKVLRDADLKLLITHARLLAEISDLREMLGQLPLWLVGADGDQSFEKRFSRPAGDFSPPRLQAHDDAVILYTSGTTGEPKGVVLDPINLAQFPRCMAEVYGLDSDDVWGCILPMSHIAGPTYLNAVADKASSLVILEQLNPTGLLEGLDRHKISVFHGVPIIFQLLLAVPNLAEYDTRSLELVGIMGTTVPLSLMRAFKKAQPHVKVVQGYGLTETSPMITLTELHRADDKMASIGRAVPGVEIKVVNEKGEELVEGEAGEIITRGPHVMKGYFRKPEATADRIRSGWFYTGDIGTRDSDGYYYHLGRKDDMIITGGLKVYPAEVEIMLCEHPQVQEAVVFPVPDSKRGNVLGAAVVLRSGAKVREKELLSYLRSNLANFKVPQQIRFCDSLPRTSTGKVVREASLLHSTQ